MANLLASTDLSNFVSGIRDHFETFANLHTIVVVKEPRKVIIDNNANTFAGYEGSSNVSNYTLVPESGIFNGMVFSSSQGFDSALFAQIPVGIVVGQKIIKVERPAKDYIEIGQTERIIIDNIDTYTQQSQGFVRNYGDQEYYYFVIHKTA